MINTILFDLDATLARMDQDTFVNTYIRKLGEKVARQGFDPAPILKALWAGTGAVLKNDGSMTNEQLFWKVFSGTGTFDADALMPVLDEFYAKDFDSIGAIVAEPNPYAADIIATLRRKGYKVGLATSPVFPRVATQLRIGWAGLKPEDFDIITTYENSRYCKPTSAYYQDVLTAIGSDASECLMVGNDVDEDMCTADMGMSVYLVTDYLLNRHDKDYSHYPQGTMADLAAYLETLPDLRF